MYGAILFRYQQTLSLSSQFPMRKDSICIVGLGYIGLPTAAVLAQHDYRVCGVDINAEVVETINQGKIHIVEPDLDTAVATAVAQKRLKATQVPQTADVFMICVPTPFHPSADGIPQPSIDYVLAAARSIAPTLQPGNLVILESTSPVGTTERVAKELQTAGVDLSKIHIAYCPERVLPGRIIEELVQNDRIIGGLTPEASQIGKEFYQTFCEGEILTTNARTAELCKLTENSCRDVNIAFANELSMICEGLNIDIYELIELANRHPRVNVLQPGCGVGGHCIAVDPWFIAAADPTHSQLIQTARRVNDYKSKWVVEKIRAAATEFEQSYDRGPTIACLGLAFKPNVDDLRESPALLITQRLIADGYDVLPVEPNIRTHNALRLTPWNVAIDKADILVVLVAHKEFDGLTTNGKLLLNFCKLKKETARAMVEA